MHTTGGYRSEAAYRLAEKVRNSDAAASVDLTININGVLSNRDINTIGKINLAISSQKSFILYADADHYCVIDPAQLYVECVSMGLSTQEVCKDMKQFQNRVKIAVVAYPNYFDNAETDTLLLLPEDHSRNRLGYTAGGCDNTVPVLRDEEHDQG